MRGMIDGAHSDAMTSEFNTVRLRTLRTLCDTFVPSLKVTPDPLGFWARSASDLHVDSELAAYMQASLPPPVLSALSAFLDVLAASVVDRLEFSCATVPAHRFQFRHRSRLSQILPKDGDIDIR